RFASTNRSTSAPRPDHPQPDPPVTNPQCPPVDAPDSTAMTTEQPPEASEPGAGNFADLGLRPELLAALDALGYEEPTPLQREAIPPLIAGRDLVGQAATGTGKTAAFALPVLQRLAE